METDKDIENKSIGQILKDEREKKGLSYAQISEITKIRPAILEAIEKEAWDRLPPPVFVKGFIRAYAHVLGLDPEFAVEMYNKKAPSMQYSVFSEQQKKKSKKWIFILLSLSSLIVLLVLFGVKNYILKKEVKTPAHENIKKMSTIFIEESIYSPVILKAKTKESIWLKVEMDNYKKEKYLLQPGEYISWHIEKDFKLIAGDAGCIELWLNNMPVHFDKKHGQMLCLYVHSKKQKGVNKI